tara:strand:- start:370 stop:684 length:315 start_codon:yes stop_codon:yes gene_type:complete
MKKLPKQNKQNTRKEKEILQDYFIKCRNIFLDSCEENIKTIENNFPLYAKDKTQVPCLLTMDIITHSEFTMNEREFLSYKTFVQDVLDGWRPPLELEVIEGGKK